jgi:hypothetical protein
MFHKVKAVNALPDYRLSVQFAEGVTNADGSSTVRFGHTPPLFIFVQ